MADLPPPPLPAHVDMTGNDWFPLHHQKLSDNAWWQTASHVARSCHIDLLLKAYRQVPAGSLPDDERELAVACGMHRDLEAFRAVRDALLETWVLCADGRWYHPELAAICLETWERLDAKRRTARERVARMRARARGEAEVLRVTPPPVTRDIATQDKTRQDRTPDSVPAEPKPAKGWAADAAFGSAWDACTKQMRERSKSRERTWLVWRKAAAAIGEEPLLAALKAYLKGHRDLERTGGPGLHKWLSDGQYEHWLPAEPKGPCEPPDPHARWRRILREYSSNGYWPGDEGPRPGRPGCRCPPELLAALNLPSTPMASTEETKP